MPGLVVAGNHGLEIVGPGWEHVDAAVAEQVPYVDELAAALTKAMEKFPGVLVEEKGLSVSVHRMLRGSAGGGSGRDAHHTGFDQPPVCHNHRAHGFRYPPAHVLE